MLSASAAIIYTASAAWHGVSAYYFGLKPGPFVKTYRLTDERSEILASDVLSWQSGIHAVLSLYSLTSFFRIFSTPKLDLQPSLILGATALSQALLVRPHEVWRPELQWLTIINAGLAFSNLLLSLVIYRSTQSNMILDVLNGVQKLINK